MEEYDALVIPGGSGVLSNLCSVQGGNKIVPNQDLKEVVRLFHREGKALAMCGTAALIAPLLLPRNLTLQRKVKVYFGPAKSALSQSATKLWQQNHLEEVAESVDEADGFFFDHGYNLYTTPASWTEQDILHPDPEQRKKYHLVYSVIKRMLDVMNMVYE